jgi:predicted glycogen debranching enzyme
VRIAKKNFILQKDKSLIMDFESGIGKEWLVANGLGGYSSSTLIGCNTRKYHGLLIASLDPPVKRRVLLSKFEEEIESEGALHSLSTNEFEGVTLHPRGFAAMHSFSLDPFPSFKYLLGDLSIIKRIFPIHGLNAVVTTYSVRNPDGQRILLRARPFLTSRGIHEIGRPSKIETTNKKNQLISCAGETFLGMGCHPGKWSQSELSENETWYRNFLYRMEREGKRERIPLC